MAVKVADLYAQLETRGNMVSDLAAAEKHLTAINAGAKTADKTLQAMKMGPKLPLDVQAITTKVKQIETATMSADKKLQGMKVGTALTSDLRKAEVEVGGLGVKAQQTGEKIQKGMKVPEKFKKDTQESGKFLEGLGEKGKQAGEKLTEGLNKGAEKLGAMGEEGGGSFLAGFSEKVMALGSKAGPIGMAVAGVVAIGLGAGAVLAKAIGDGMEMQVDQAKVQAQLGVDAPTMAKIGRAAADSYTQVFGESVSQNMDAAKEAMQAGLLGGDATQQEITKTINGLQTVASITGEEIPAASRAAAQLMKTGLAKNSQEAFDIIVKGQQAGLNTSEDWLDTITEYSTQFRKLGLSAGDSLGLMQQMIKGGARDTDIAADAIKEFSIRAVDGSDTTAKGFQTLGLDAQQMTERFAKGGTSARDAFGEVLDKIRAIQDPAQKAQVEVALFGTQAEDLGDALNRANLGTAATELGNVAGAAKNAADVMSNNAASSIEGAKRSIETSMDGVKLSLAQAFGPALTQVGNWVSEHKPEITGFFVELANVALTGTQGMLSFASGTLRAFAMMAEGSANFFGPFLKDFGSTVSFIGSVVKHLPGMSSMGQSFEKIGNAAQSYQGTMQNLSSTLDHAADTADKANTGLGHLKDQVVASGAQAVATQEMFRALGTAVVSVPDGKTITVNDNSPEAQERFKQLGIHIEQIPGSKDFKLVADTTDGQTRIDDFIKENDGKEVTLKGYVSFQQSVPESALKALHGDAQADGGVYDRQAQMTDKPILWGEAGPEAYIPLSPDKRARSTALLADVAKRFGMKLTEMAQGGIVDTKALTQKATGIEGAIYTWGGWDGSWNTDCSGAQARMANMIAFGDPDKGGRFSTGNEGEALTTRGFILGQAPPGIPAYEIGWFNDPNAIGGGHTAGTAYDGKGGSINIEMGGDRGNGQYGGAAAGSRNKEFTQHAYRALTTGKGAGTSTGIKPGDQFSWTDSNSSFATPGSASSSKSSSSSSSSSASSTPEIQKVEVINWPQAIMDPNGNSAKARFGVALYGDGGTVPGVGSQDTHPALLTPGEEVIKKGPATQHRSLLKMINDGQVKGYADGGTVGSGFGGDYDPNPDPSHPLSLMDMAGLAAGLGFTAASAFDSGGKFQGFNTSNTTIPGLDDALKALAEKLQPQPAVVIEHAEVKADNPQQLIGGLANVNPALTQIVQRGLI